MELKDLDPYEITVLDENGESKKKTFGQYVFQHGTRDTTAIGLLQINTKRKTNKHDVDKMLSSALEQRPKESEQRSDRDIHQRALGQFHRLVISSDEVICNCENHKRFRNCNEKCLFQLLCLPMDSFPKEVMLVRPLKQGRYSLKDNQKWLRNAFRNRILETGKRMMKEEEKKAPPKVDPF